MRLKRPVTTAIVTVAVAATVGAALAGPLGVFAQSDASHGAESRIQHVVVIFQENVSFDHYFGTYPMATNSAGEPSFTARDGTPAVNGLTPDLLSHNPNLANPRRLDRSQAVTCDQDHTYRDEQRAVDNGKMDQFVQTVSGSSCPDKSTVMDYYDGNTVTALWNYAQHYAMSDSSFGTNYGPSAVGALNLISGQTHGATPTDVSANTAHGSVIGDPGPVDDDCAASYPTRVSMSGKNVGDLLNAKGITWGWFQGGFRPSTAWTASTHTAAVCNTISGSNIAGRSRPDYIGHHEPFQYYTSTANPHHLPPTSAAMIGKSDRANHQYDLSDFWTAVHAGNIPAVSYLKAPAYQDGHAGYSDPLDEQTFLVNTINQIEQSKDWASTAIVIAYDDSDGWYDHVFSPVVNPSSDSSYDAVYGAGLCGTPAAGAYQDRCGYGPRLPLLVISPFAKTNFVDHQVTDQSSILRFIEDNWNLGRIGDQSFDARAGDLAHMLTADVGHSEQLILDPSTGQPVAGAGARR
jgi:phospholipase C